MFKKVLTRIVALLPALALQIVWYMLIIGFLGKYSGVLTTVISILSVLFVLYIINKRDEASYKILWLLVILFMPFLGTILYLFMGNKGTGKGMRKKLTKTRAEIPIKEDKSAIEALAAEDKRTAQTLEYIGKITGFGVDYNTSAEYYPLGEDMFEAMRHELEKAKKYIFVEYFILQNGIFWDGLVEILARKASEGVDVRVMYDDLGSIGTYSRKNLRQLREKGIKCEPFNPLIFIKGQLNNRDHRKIMVIDGKVAFSGGINISDEYINETHPFGHWKDIGFKITGNGVYSYTYMFIEFWNAFSLDKIPADYLEDCEKPTVDASTDGYIMSYYDSPMYEEPASNILFGEMLATAEKYIWFYTPYLMIGDTLKEAFIRAARRGVDVRIIMPGVPDKKLIYRLSRSYYRPLLEAGVRIFEYTPGFVHAKGCICDDKIVTVGTVNLDYRSLFLHFECNSLFYKSAIVQSVKSDYEDCLDKSNERKLDNIKTGFLHIVIDAILRIFAPLC